MALAPLAALAGVLVALTLPAGVVAATHVAETPAPPTTAAGVVTEMSKTVGTPPIPAVPEAGSDPGAPAWEGPAPAPPATTERATAEPVTTPAPTPGDDPWGSTDGELRTQGPITPTVEGGQSYHTNLFDWSYVTVWADARDDDGYITRLVVDYGDGTPPLSFPGDPNPCEVGANGWPLASSAAVPFHPPTTHHYAQPGDYRKTVTVYSAGCDGSSEQKVVYAVPGDPPWPWPPPPPPPPIGLRGPPI